MPAIARPSPALACEWTADGFAVVSFTCSDGPHAALPEQLLADLATMLDHLARGPTPAALILRSAGPGAWGARPDPAHVGRLATLDPDVLERLCDDGKRVFTRFSAGCPTVAVIDGACLGVGLELALACDLRVATDEPHTCCGLPDVKLGLSPGWGGLVRLPRLIGPGPAVELAVSGEPLTADRALRLGLLDACVPVDQALESARRLVHAAAAAGGIARRRRRLSEPVALDPAERDFLEATTAAVIRGRTGGHYPAAPTLLRTILAGAEQPADQAARLESEAFATLAQTPVSAGLIRVFTIGERNRLDPGAASATAAVPTPVVAPAIVGAGIMGAAIAAAHLRRGFTVMLVDAEPGVLAAGVPRILAESAQDPATPRADSARALASAAALRTATSIAAVSGADLVIESVTERPDVKQQVLVRIEETVAATAILATNTSTNPIARLAAGLAEPARFCGMHFFNPVSRMALVEVVRGPATSDDTVARAVAHAKRLGKCPIVVRDSPGFLVNRILMPYLHEAGELLREGVAADRIDRVARDFGMPMGPIELYDMIGLDTSFYAGLVMSAAFGDRIEASPVIPALVKAGRLGRKTGAGFYAYADIDGRERITAVDPTAAATITRYAHPPRPSSDPAITDRLFLPMLLEAVRALDEGIVRDGSDIDLAVIHALGFPAFRGGLLAWGDAVGAAEILRRLEPLAELGPRMRPPARLVEIARRSGRLTG